MGGDHDLMDPISHHGAKGITHVEAKNREFLRSVMEDCGFASYECEWWHYTLKDEPYPDTYFNFLIAKPAFPVVAITRYERLRPTEPIQPPR